MFINRRFRNYEYFGRTSKDSKFFQEGEPCPSIGKFSNLQKRSCCKALAPIDQYLNKVHLEIVFGDTISNLSYRYAILLINRANKYIRFFIVKSLMFECIIKALKHFRADSGSLSKKFCCDCNQKLLGSNACHWVYCVESKIIGAPAGRQSTNGMAERAWATF